LVENMVYCLLTHLRWLHCCCGLSRIV
jgi:hypothetical protein